MHRKSAMHISQNHVRQICTLKRKSKIKAKGHALMFENFSLTGADEPQKFQLASTRFSWYGNVAGLAKGWTRCGI
jgi:hypothetical protein